MKTIFNNGILVNTGTPTTGGGPFINEFHYDNSGTDSGEFVEICAPAGFDVTGFQLVLYNQSGNAYDTFTLDPASACAAADGNDYYVINTPGIQNGGNDGLALINGAGGVCEFLSYEGVTTAANGPAAGMTSTDIGVSETGSTLVGESLQLNPATGMWQAPMPQTPKTANICFLSGTGIQTPTGHVNIESLQVGDLVSTASGKEMPVKWIGIQSVNINSNRNLLKSNPILIHANALGDGIPSVDLRISPNHAIHIEGLLINGGALVNGINIIQETPTEDFKYYHIELDAHELVIAENTWSESYLPQNENRDDFDNASEFDKQYPDGRKLILWPLDYPRISSQVKVPEYIKDMILRKEEIKKIA